ncbi:Kiwa anti-phage protein KwaB-like domain-containing protein [Chlorobium sp. N1]|uniref:Kiwa anti-phage protein KwaB-like domain-containing protein n=1 Tax=Chlorobium sp. N1 TaxID=2491138 RepID=UPI0010402620|nr:Kiwa anti-phage protein KwaB-like domain-containing protein [Chlorobium sp. N1]TCD46820.1 DUF4868 domain-containing protein [Chlorobium sp. N1]
MGDVAEVPFDPGYSPDPHEKFSIGDYVMPDWLQDETSQTVSDHDSLSLHEDQLEAIKGIVAFARDAQGDEIILFQDFNRSHMIKPGRFLLLQHDTFESVSRPALTLGSKLDAVILRAERRLLFRSFRVTNTFLPLMEFYTDASEQEIRAVLSHETFIAEDADALAENAGQWFRKRFAMLRDSGILEHYSAEQIVARSEAYDIEIRLEQGKIVFPSDRSGAKRLLQFLNEEIYRGAITDTLYETNSKRETD